jgi:CubicO group peptidase (beta-lactamase class C family)
MRLSYCRAVALGAWFALANCAFASPASADAPAASAQSAAARLLSGQSIPALELERFVDGAIRDAMDSEHIAGVSVAVVQDGETVVLKGYGIAGPGQAMDPMHTMVRIGSVSKTFTWIALMKEVEAGRVKLDAPVNDYLPEELRIPDQGYQQPIRVIDLMSHSPGFEDLSMGHLFVYEPDRVMPIADYLARHRPDRVREPGQLASYSNYGAALAGYIVARLNGEDFESVIEREVFAPLGMASSTFREPYAARAGLPEPMPQAQAARLSPGYSWNGSEFVAKDFEYISQVAPAGSVSMTAADMARYMRMLLGDGTVDGVQIFGPQAAKAFRTQILNVGEGTNGWAHGFMARPLPGGFKTFGHGGATQLFFSNMMIIPALRMGVFANSNTTSGRALVERLPKLIVENFYVAPTPRRVGDPKLLEIADRYTGRYIPTRRAYSGLEKFVQLLGFEDAVSVTPSGYLVTRIGSSSQAWVPDGAPGRFRAAEGDQRLVFALDADGRAVSFPITRGNYTVERANWILDVNLFATVAALVLAVALVLWIRVLTHARRNAHSTRWQRLANVGSLAAAALWLVALATFALASIGESAGHDWPTPLLLTASTAALLAALGSVALLAVTPLVWRGDAQAEQGGWSVWRKSFHTIAVVLFVCFAALVGLRGGLLPWA